MGPHVNSSRVTSHAPNCRMVLANGTPSDNNHGSFCCRLLGLQRITAMWASAPTFGLGHLCFTSRWLGDRPWLEIICSRGPCLTVSQQRQDTEITRTSHKEGICLNLPETKPFSLPEACLAYPIFSGCCQGSSPAYLRRKIAYQAYRHRLLRTSLSLSCSTRNQSRRCCHHSPDESGVVQNTSPILTHLDARLCPKQHLHQ